jgi:hypothetical protein
MDHTRKQTMIICPKSNRGIAILQWFAKIDKKEDHHQFIGGNEQRNLSGVFHYSWSVPNITGIHWLTNIRFAWLSLPDFVLQTCIYPLVN